MLKMVNFVYAFFSTNLILNAFFHHIHSWEWCRGPPSQFQLSSTILKNWPCVADTKNFEGLSHREYATLRAQIFCEIIGAHMNDDTECRNLLTPF